MYALGVDIGGTKIAVGVVAEDGEVIADLRTATDTSDAAAIETAIGDSFRELSNDYELCAIGVAAAGFCSPERDRVLFSPNIPAWRDYPLAERVREATQSDLPIAVENDANAAGWAEYQFGVGRDVTDFVMLTVGTGLGGAAVLNGKLLRGAYGVATEVGHMRVVPDGQVCGCGEFGCWEQYASGTALERFVTAAIAADPETVSWHDGEGPVAGTDITKAAQSGDRIALAGYEYVGSWLGAGLATVAAFCDPALIAIGGGVAEAGDLLLRPVQASFDKALSGRAIRSDTAKIVTAKLANTAGLIGAADLARQLAD